MGILRLISRPVQAEESLGSDGCRGSTLKLGARAITSVAESEIRQSLHAFAFRNSETCPTCGLRVQRDSDATNCPEAGAAAAEGITTHVHTATYMRLAKVQCPSCGTIFRCTVVSSTSSGLKREGDGMHWDAIQSAVHLSLQAGRTRQGPVACPCRHRLAQKCARAGLCWRLVALL